MDERYQLNRPLIFTTNVEEKAWAEYLGDPVSTRAILYRIFTMPLRSRSAAPVIDSIRAWNSRRNMRNTSKYPIESLAQSSRALMKNKARLSEMTAFSFDYQPKHLKINQCLSHILDIQIITKCCTYAAPKKKKPL